MYDIGFINTNIIDEFLVKKEHDLVGIDLLPVPFEEFYQFFNQLALDKATVTC